MHPSLARKSAAFRSGPLRSRGSVLIEGLIAILVFSVGILAIVRLQATAINNTQDAKLRADASFVASQIIGQMWADRGLNSVNVPCYAHPAAGACPSAASTAAKDAWIASFTVPGGPNYLPGAQNNRQVISVDANGKVTVIIRWQMPGDASERSFSTVAQIRG